MYQIFLLFFLAPAAGAALDRDAYLEKAVPAWADARCSRTGYPQSCFAFKDLDECRVIYREEQKACLAPRLGVLPTEGTEAEFQTLLASTEDCVQAAVTHRLRTNQQFIDAPGCEKLIATAEAPRWWGIAGAIAGTAIGLLLAFWMMKTPKKDA